MKVAFDQEMGLIELARLVFLMSRAFPHPHLSQLATQGEIFPQLKQVTFLGPSCARDPIER